MDLVSQIVGSLDQRAQPKDYLLPATAISSAGDFAEGKVFFQDHSSLSFKVSVLQAAPGLLLNIGEQDNFFACQPPIVGDHCPLQLSVASSPVQLTLLKDNKVLWSSVLFDEMVGGIGQSHALYKWGPGVGLCFDMEGELFYGGGEDFGPLVKNHTVLNLANKDILGVGTNDRYQNTPWFYSSKGFIFGLLQDGPSRIDFGSERLDVLSLTSTVPALQLVIIDAPTPSQGMQNLRQLFADGKIPPRWSYDLWISRCYYQDQKEVDAVVAEITARKLQPAVINLDARTWMDPKTRTDFVWDKSRFAPFTEYLPQLREKGLHVCLWENPYVSILSERFTEGQQKGFFAKNKNGEVYQFSWVPQGLKGFPAPTPAALVDFTLPAAWDWWKSLHLPYLAAGVTAFKTDFGEEIPLDCYFANGKTGLELRNSYADLYNLCVDEAVADYWGAEGAIWARSGYLQVHRYPIKWGGDSQTNWRSLRATVRACLSQVVGGAYFWASDTGGFYGPKPEPELFLRWSQLSMWNSHMRLHGTTAREPWAFGEKTWEIFKRSLDFRRHCLNYFVAEGRRLALAKESFVRPLWYQFPADPHCRRIDDQFMAGCDVLVAPFLNTHPSRELYLPAADWLDLRTGEICSGGQFITSQRTVDLPVFVRQNSIYKSLFLQAMDHRGTN